MSARLVQGDLFTTRPSYHKRSLDPERCDRTGELFGLAEQPAPLAVAKIPLDPDQLPLPAEVREAIAAHPTFKLKAGTCFCTLTQLQEAFPEEESGSWFTIEFEYPVDRTGGTAWVDFCKHCSRRSAL